MSRIEQSDKSELLTPKLIQSQKYSNTKLVANFLRFPTVTHMPKSVEQNRSYACRNTVHMQKFSESTRTQPTVFITP
jgi:hypothetical protein